MKCDTLRLFTLTAVTLVLVAMHGDHQNVFAQGGKPKIIQDAEYYILDAQQGEKWAVQDKELDTKLAALRKKHGQPPNIIHVLWDDTPVGEVGIPFIQKQRGWETPNINRLAAEGINFTRMCSEPSCTQTRAAFLTGRLPVRNGMTKVGFPYEYGGLPASEVTVADVLSKAGYATAFYGKAHVGDIEATYMNKRGFDDALWMPYNQALSAFTPQGQAGMLSPAVMFPEMYAKDIYDIDPGWRPRGYVFALEGAKGGLVREFGRPPNLEDYLKLEGEFEKRTLAFIQKNAAAKEPFFVAWWPSLGALLPSPKKLTANGGVLAELLTPFDARIGTLMSELEKLGIAENTLVVIMADNGPFTHGGPPGWTETIYRGGKGDFLEGGVRVPAMAWWPGVIPPGQLVGDIIHVTDLFTTFAHIGGATENLPTDRILDGIDQTSLLLNGDGFSRRDYIHLYLGTTYAATVKGRYKRHWGNDKSGGLASAMFDLFSDPREEHGQLIPMLPAKAMFDQMRARHELWIEKYPHTPEQRGFPLQGLENPRAEIKALGQPRMNGKDLPFNPLDVIKKIKGFEGADFGKAD